MDTLVIMDSPTSNRSPVVFPKNRRIFEQFDENIKLAYKRRGYTQAQISERTALSRLTIIKIEQGEPSVSIGHYIAVLSVPDLAQVASDDIAWAKASRH